MARRGDVSVVANADTSIVPVVTAVITGVAAGVVAVNLVVSPASEITDSFRYSKNTVIEMKHKKFNEKTIF